MIKLIVLLTLFYLSWKLFQNRIVAFLRANLNQNLQGLKNQTHEKDITETASISEIKSEKDSKKSS